MSIRSLSVSLLTALFVASTPVVAQELPATISISATGKVTAAPDMAIITSGVVTQGKTAREALSANNQAMAALLEVLRAAGVEDRHIQTSNFSVQPNFVHSNKRDENGYSLAPKIDGYRVSNDVSVQIMELDNLGAVLDQSVTVGANAIHGVNFAVEDPGKLLDAARELAMKEAIDNAQIYANAANVELGKILSISENSGYRPEPMMANARMDMVMSEAVPVMSGELNYTMTVSVQWDIEQ